MFFRVVVPLLQLLLFVISLPAFALACAIWAIVGYQSVTRLGYRPPAAAAVLLLGACSGVVSTVIRQPPNSTGYRFFVDFFWLTLLFAVAATAIAVVALPRRELRTFGKRQPRFPFVKGGHLLIACAWLLAALAVSARLAGAVSSRQLANGLVLAFTFLLPTGGYLIRRGRRALADAASAEHAAEALDHPVLYLRAFNQERQYFAIAPAVDFAPLAKSWEAAVSRPDQNIGMTFEEYFGDAVRAPLGPMVALGSPEDYIAPEGAARLYAKDSDWMQHVATIARKARAIVVEVGASTHLRWEFEHIRREGLQQKLFVITRPSAEGKWLAWAFWRLVWRIQGIPRVSFRAFAKALASLGYDLGDCAPLPGSVFAFDENGKGFLLTTGAAWPGEFVSPIRDWIVDRRLSGRHVPATCPRCSRPVFTVSDAMAQLCRDCRYGAAWKRAWTRVASRVYVLVWIFVVLPAATLLPGLLTPAGSVLEPWKNWLAGASFIASFAGLLLVLGRMDDPPPLRDPDTTQPPTARPAERPRRVSRGRR